MAKKKKPEVAEGEEGAAPPPNKKKKMIMIGVGLAVLLGAGGGGYMFMKGKDKKADDHTASAEGSTKFGAVIDLEEMKITLAQAPGEDRQTFLKMKIALEVADPEIVKKVTPLMPRVVDSFQVFMRELRPSDLEGSAGLYRLKEEMMRRVNVAVYPNKVDAILFKELLVQ